ncbi:RNA-directed DNA polymerase, eukaryota [Tanacetum coccineum]
MHLCVKTRVHHLISESFKVILEGKVSVVRAKEVTRWEGENDDEVIPNSFQSIVNEYNIMENFPDDVENSPRKMENSLDHVENYDVQVENSPKISPKQLENSHIYVENSHVHVENSLKQIENSTVHVENFHAHVKNSHDLSGVLFGLEKLILESEKKRTNVEQEASGSDPLFPLGVPNNMSPAGSKHGHVDSLAPSLKPVNGFSILECFEEFINIGQAMGFGKWLDTDSDLLFMLVYSPQDVPRKRQLWVYMTGIINHWHGEVVVMRDFNEVRFTSERYGSTLYALNAAEFNSFITNSHLIDVPLCGYSFMWSDKHASKMSKLD